MQSNNQKQNNLQVPEDARYYTNPTQNQQKQSFLGNSNITSQSFRIETPEEHAANILKRQHRIHICLAAAGSAIISSAIVYSIMFSMYNPTQAQETATNISEAFSTMAAGVWNFVFNLSFLAGVFVGVGIEKSNVIGRVKQFVTGSNSHENQVLQSTSQIDEKTGQKIGQQI